MESGLIERFSPWCLAFHNFLYLFGSIYSIRYVLHVNLNKVKIVCCDFNIAAFQFHACISSLKFLALELLIFILLPYKGCNSMLANNCPMN